MKRYLLVLAAAFAASASAEQDLKVGNANTPNTKPAFLRNVQPPACYDGVSNDLLTAGLGKTGLQGAAPAFTNPAAPSAAELRRNASLLDSVGEGIARLRAVEKVLRASSERCSVQLFSSLDGSGAEQARTTIAGWLGLSDEETEAQNKNPRLKGSKAGGKNALIGIKAPAQGGEAGDDARRRLRSETRRGRD